jgi:hypothetical protein
MCGCNGNWNNASHAPLDAHDKVSDRAVKQVITKIKNNMIDGARYGEIEVTDQYVYVELNGRIWAAYYLAYEVKARAEREARKQAQEATKNKLDDQAEAMLTLIAA